MMAAIGAGTAFERMGRGLAGLLFLFWGAFFVEHLGEWFSGKGGAWPPRWVWVAQGLHLAMLLALAATAIWGFPGGGATILATAAFFATIGPRSFPWLALLNLAPIVLLVIGRLLKDEADD